MKRAKLMVGIILVLIAVGAGAYFGYLKFKNSKEVSFACVATSFPYVVMEHKRAELTNLLDNIDLNDKEEPRLEAVDKAMKDKKPQLTQYFLSKEIDTRMLELADSIQNRPSDAPALKGEEMADFLTQLEPIFAKQAATYMSACKSLFSSIVGSCGSFDNNSEEAQSCRDKYDPQVNAMLQEHLAAKGL